MHKSATMERHLCLQNHTHKIVHSSAMHYQNLIIIRECSKKLLPSIITSIPSIKQLSIFFFTIHLTRLLVDWISANFCFVDFPVFYVVRQMHIIIFMWWFAFYRITELKQRAIFHWLWNICTYFTQYLKANRIVWGAFRWQQKWSFEIKKSNTKWITYS